MINRTLIRLKIVQLMYSYYQKSSKNINSLEQELQTSLSKAYDLYNYMLWLITDVTRYAEDEIEQKEQINRYAHRKQIISHRFIDNKFAAQLAVNKQLLEFKENQNPLWKNYPDYLRKLYADIQQMEVYDEYMKKDSVDYNDDRELWRKIYKNIIVKDERIDDILEEQSLYWNDDKEIVDTFVLKTIKKFEQQKQENQELLPEFKDEEDREFAIMLLRKSILQEDDFRSMIMQNARNWDFERLPLMDVIIMQVALSEIVNFPNIPISVTINEFVEISKYYSTQKSAGYINGIIDNVARQLKANGKIMK